MRAMRAAYPASSRTSTWAGVSASATSTTVAGNRLTMLVPSARARAKLTSRAWTRTAAAAPGIPGGGRPPRCLPGIESGQTIGFVMIRHDRLDDHASIPGKGSG